MVKIHKNPFILNPKMLQSHKNKILLALLTLLVVSFMLMPNITQNQASVLHAEVFPPVAVMPPVQNIPMPSPQAVAQPSVSVVTETKATFPNQYSLAIDAIGLNIPLGETYLDDQKHLMVPGNPNQAAWYASGPKPGNSGTALITGHLDSLAGPGVFWNLKKVQLGNLLEITKPDGSIATFKVDRIESVPQDHRFPWSEVYSTKGAAQIRIITCDGEYNPVTGRYNRNLVVFGTLQ